MISPQVLTTKLYPPPPRPNLVTRPRLVERLTAGLQANHRLILVSAAAGFGKTTLASKWIAESHLEGSIAWISLDEEDNNPIRFLFYLIAALQQVDAAIGENIIPVLRSAHAPLLTELAEQLLNQIAVSKKNILLMLDDYHLITADTVHQIMQRIIERQPAQMHTVILTREDPPLPLPRMRVRGEVIEIRERDLRFTLPEAQAFLVEAMRLDLTAADVEKLKDRTEGWVAGMQLAALALEDYPDEADRRAFIDAFTGSDRFIVDYLVSEVLDRQTGPVRDFLLQTSFLERFCAELCDYVVYGKAGAGKSQPVLDRLEQGNMFLVPLDSQRQWYRYHHLFAEMLYHFLRRSAPDQMTELYRRASDWSEERRLIPEAVKYATAYAAATGDWGPASSLLARHATPMILHGQGGMVIRWCQAFPKTVLERLPEICIAYALALVLTFRTDYLDAVEEKLEWALPAGQLADTTTGAGAGREGSHLPQQNWITGQICAIRSQILLSRFHTYIDPQELICLSLKALELLPESEKAIRATCKINLAHAQLMQSNPVEAQQALEESLPFMLEAGNYLGGITSIFYQARLAYYLGQFERAEALCREWKAKFTEMAATLENDIPAIRGLDIMLSFLLMERLQFGEAETMLEQALELPGWASWMEILGFIGLARLQFLRGDYAGAEETLRRMSNMGPQHAGCAEALRILFMIRTLPIDDAMRAKVEAWLQKAPPDPTHPYALGIGPYHCDVEYFCHLAWAEVQLALGHPDQALIFVRPALDSAKEHQLPARILDLTIMQALIDDALGDESLALAGVETALQLGETYGFIRVFTETPNIVPLLHKAIQQNIHPQFARRILSALKQASGGERTPGTALLQKEVFQYGLSEPLEPLSERELEVLHLISGGCSNGEIADRLYITQGTVKRHITNLYGKLAVQSRTQAIAKARTLGLLR